MLRARGKWIYFLGFRDLMAITFHSVDLHLPVCANYLEALSNPLSFLYIFGFQETDINEVTKLWDL